MSPPDFAYDEVRRRELAAISNSSPWVFRRETLKSFNNESGIPLSGRPIDRLGRFRGNYGLEFGIAVAPFVGTVGPVDRGDDQEGRD
ncbi:hypothetical protein Poly59_50460 [Rubripirellula reticaptiva]|uniref:Uncharacterized protein n=1 Tax=Rubripirellula reticaptiva TaxID=2528013 RepID=A0A5C6EI33_9BACT|nr:hypothetical protein Poly59_50460 [Rubripirellula reticaptiva]